MTKISLYLCALFALCIRGFTLCACDLNCGEHNCGECRTNIGPSIYGSTGKWADRVTPKRDWECTKVEDLEEPSLKCEMCEKETLRYVHHMRHPTFAQRLRVGCICAGHMEGDLDGAQNRESAYKSYFNRKKTWLNQKWKTSKKGSPYLRKDKHVTVISKSQFGGFSACIDKSFLRQNFTTQEAAKMGAFEHLYHPVNGLIYNAD